MRAVRIPRPVSYSRQYLGRAVVVLRSASALAYVIRFRALVVHTIHATPDGADA